MTAGTRTAPTVDGTGTYRRAVIRTIDESGDQKSDGVRFPVTATNAEIEAYVAAYQAVSQASVFSVIVEETYSAVEDKNDAATGTRDSVYDVLNVLTRNATGDSKSVVLRAPEPGVMIANSDEIDPTDVALGTFLTAAVALLNGGAGGAGTYEAISIRFTERREINERIKL